MANNGSIELIEKKEQKQDGETCLEAWVEGKADLQKITTGQYSDYMEIMEKIQTLRFEYHNIPRHIELMKKAVRIFSGV